MSSSPLPTAAGAINATPAPISLNPTSQQQEDYNERDLMIGRIFYDTTFRFINHPANIGAVPYQFHTKIAKKYSHPIGLFNDADHRILKGGYTSGLTPMSPANPTSAINSNRTVAERMRARRKVKLEALQRNRLKGFTTTELQRIGGLTALDESVMIDDLANSIHPMFAKPRWLSEDSMPKHKGKVPILGDGLGYWEVENPIVWEILEPCLKLASRALVNELQYAWLDTLFNGVIRSRWHPDPSKSQQEFYQIYHIQPRTQEERMRSPSSGDGSLKEKIEAVGRNITFCLRSGFSSFWTDLPDSPSNDCGRKITNACSGAIYISLSIEMLQPLLRDDLTDSEKITSRVEIASTLVHEFAHACGNHITPKYTEPYIDNEPLPELGYSFVSQIWGNASHMNEFDQKGGPGLPILGIMKENWFVDKHASYNGNDVVVLKQLVMPGDLDPFTTYDYWVVPTSWSGDLFRENTWTIKLASQGKTAITMGPLKYGTQTVNNRDGKQSLVRNLNDGSVSAQPFEALAINLGLSPAQKSAAQAENARVSRLHNIFQRMELNTQAINSNTASNEMDLGPDEIYIIGQPLGNDFSGCPRYDEIKEYFVTNRAPLELAFDTMGLLPITTLHRYIRDRGGKSITAMELRAFLFEAHNVKDELFIWFPFPGYGVVIRDDKGWGPPQAYTIPHPTVPIDENDIAALIEILEAPSIQETMYHHYGEMRDLDIETYRQFLSQGIAPGPFQSPMRDPIWFYNLVMELAARGNANFTLGPKYVMRFTFAIDDFRQSHANSFTIQMMSNIEHTLKEKMEKRAKGAK